MLLLRVRGILEGTAVLLLSLLLLLLLVLLMGRHQLLVELMLPDRGRRVLLEMRGRNVVVLKVVLGGMRLTGGHHPKREAGASLTSPTAPAPTLSRLPLLLFLLQHFPLSTLFARSLSVLVSSPPFTDVLLATPTQPQVVPVTEVGISFFWKIIKSSSFDSKIAREGKNSRIPLEKILFHFTNLLNLILAVRNKKSSDSKSDEEESGTPVRERMISRGALLRWPIIG